MTTNTTAGRTRIAARLIVGTATATLAFGIGSLAAGATPPAGPTDIVACPTYGVGAPPAATLVLPSTPVRPTELTFVPPTVHPTGATFVPPTPAGPTPQIDLPDPTLVLPPPVGDPEPTDQTFTAPTEDPDCGYDPETTEPTTDTPVPGGGGDTPAADTGDLAYTGVGAGVMTVGALGLLAVGAAVLMAARHLSRRVG